MAWPLSRLSTYVGGVTPVKANDLNSIQDAIIAGKHGAIEMVLSGAGWQQQGAGVIDVINDAPMHANSAGAGEMFFTIPVCVGMTLSQVKFSMLGNGVGDLSEGLVLKTSALGIEATIGTLAGVPFTNENAGWNAKTIDVNPDYTFLTGESCTLKCSFTQLGIKMGNVAYFITHP